MLRSIEDANLVPNTYTLHYIFSNEQQAREGLDFLKTVYP
jgi:hypothetical protein